MHTLALKAHITGLEKIDVPAGSGLVTFKSARMAMAEGGVDTPKVTFHYRS